VSAEEYSRPGTNDWGTAGYDLQGPDPGLKLTWAL
jgi:hypothetical protein